MTAFGNEGGLGLYSCSLQRLEESLSLAAGHNVILLTVEDDDRRIVLIHIGIGTQTELLIWFLGQL